MPVLSPAVRGEPRALVQLDVEHILDVPPKLAARVRLLDTGQINNNDENDARSVALAALRARVVPELVAEDQTNDDDDDDEGLGAPDDRRSPTWGLLHSRAG